MTAKAPAASPADTSATNIDARSARKRGAIVGWVLGTAAYATIAFALLSPHVLYTGDSGVKFVQARSLALNGYTSTALRYPGSYLDPERRFFPFEPPQVFTRGGHIEAVYSPPSAFINAPLASLAGLPGMVALSVVSGGFVLLVVWWIAGSKAHPALLVVVGFGTILWFYSTVAWDHAPALALSMLAFWLAMTSREPGKAAIAGALLGCAGTIREESLLLGPGMLLASYLASRRRQTVVALTGAMLVPIAAAFALEAFVFGRLPATHFQHGVAAVRHALTPAAGELAIETLLAKSPWLRYDAIVHQGLIGYAHDGYIALFAALAVAAEAIRRWTGSLLGVATLCGAALVLALNDLRTLVYAPAFVNGLFRLSPFLVFAIVPAAEDARSGR